MSPLESKAAAPPMTIPIVSEGDLIEMRRAIRAECQRLGFGLTDSTRIVTAASELARNIHSYAGTGTARWAELRHGLEVGIELVFQDSGPGIADVEQAKQQGFSTGKGLGMGLSGCQRLMDEMQIETICSPTIGHGTTITLRKWNRA